MPHPSLVVCATGGWVRHCGVSQSVILKPTDTGVKFSTASRNLYFASASAIYQGLPKPSNRRGGAVSLHKIKAPGPRVYLPILMAIRSHVHEDHVACCNARLQYNQNIRSYSQRYVICLYRLL